MCILWGSVWEHAEALPSLSNFIKTFCKHFKKGPDTLPWKVLRGPFKNNNDICLSLSYIYTVYSVCVCTVPGRWCGCASQSSRPGPRRQWCWRGAPAPVQQGRPGSPYTPGNTVKLWPEAPPYLFSRPFEATHFCICNFYACFFHRGWGNII